MILLLVVCAGGLLLRAELPSVSLFVYLTAAARTLATTTTSCCSCDPTQKSVGGSQPTLTTLGEIGLDHARFVSL